MTVSPEIAAAQAAYARRPYAARQQSYCFSGTFRFDTFEQARQYLAVQIARKGANWDGASSSRNQGLGIRGSFVTMPDGTELDLEALELIEMPQGPGCPIPLIRDQEELAEERLRAKEEAERAAAPRGWDKIEAGEEIAADAPRFPNMALMFPDFDQASLPADLPTAWVDVSWRQDACPCFRVSFDTDHFVYIDFADPAEREHGGKRFSLYQYESEPADRLETDDFAELLAHIEKEGIR